MPDTQTTSNRYSVIRDFTNTNNRVKLVIMKNSKEKSSLHKENVCEIYIEIIKKLQEDKYEGTLLMSILNKDIIKELVSSSLNHESGHIASTFIAVFNIQSLLDSNRVDYSRSC